MITLYIDSRGNIHKKFFKIIKDHPKKYKNFKIVKVDNQTQISKKLPPGRMKWDVLAVEDKRVIAMFELKDGADLDNSLKNKRLQSELTEYTADANMFACERIYLICGGVYTYKIYSWLNSVMNNEFPWIRFYEPQSSEKLVEKVFELLKKPPIIKSTLIPILIKTVNKSFALSIASLIKGVSEALAVELAKNWHLQITEKEILTIINNYYNDGRNYSQLAYNIYETVTKTWFYDRPNRIKRQLCLTEFADVENNYKHLGFPEKMNNSDYDMYKYCVDAHPKIKELYYKHLYHICHKCKITYEEHI